MRFGHLIKKDGVLGTHTSGLLALFALQKLKQFVVRAECSYDVMDRDEEDDHAGAS